MSGFPRTPQILKAGLITLDAESGILQRTIVLQYNPESLSRSVQPAMGEPGGADSLRINGPPVETFKLEAELDAADQLELPDQHPDTVEQGIFPQLAALETLVYPTSQGLLDTKQLADQGAMEIFPMAAPLTLFVWSRQRVLPVNLTELSVNEEAFDTQLNPIRAKVSLGMRVLTVDDLGHDHKAGGLYMVYHKQKEALAGNITAVGLGSFGLEGIP